MVNLKLQFTVDAKSVEQLTPNTIRVHVKDVPFEQFYRDIEDKEICVGYTEALITIGKTEIIATITKMGYYTINSEKETASLTADFSTVHSYNNEGSFNLVSYNIERQLKVGSALGILINVDIEQQRVVSFIKENFSSIVTERRGIRYKYDTTVAIKRYCELFTENGVPKNEYIIVGYLVIFTDKLLPNEHDRNNLIKIMTNQTFMKEMYYHELR